MNIETLKFVLSIVMGLLIGAVSLIFWIFQVYVEAIKETTVAQKVQNEKQEAQNVKFYDLINTINITLEKLNGSIEADRKICDERHSKK